MIASLYEGTFSVGTDRQFKPINPDDKPPFGSFKVTIHPYLIADDHMTALIDAGPGPFGPLNHYAIMTENLSRHGVTSDDIEYVFCSHLHTDHIGGLLKPHGHSFELSFPNARIRLSGREWEQFKKKANENRKTDAIRWTAFLENHADLTFTEDHPDETGPVYMETIGGHTEFSQAIFYNNGGLKAMMLGDVLARPEIINRRFVAKFDFDAVQSRNKRAFFLEKALRENYYILTFHGSNGAIIYLKEYDPKKGYLVEHITSGVIQQGPPPAPET